MPNDLPFPQFSAGSCINCGFLSALDGYITREQGPATMQNRRDAFFGAPVSLGGSSPKWEDYDPPRCWVRAENLPAQVAKLAPGDAKQSQAARRTIIEEPRECDSAVIYKPWLSFAEHWDLFIMNELEERRQLWQKDLEGDRRTFWAEYDIRKGGEETKWNERFHRLAKWQTAVTIISAVIGAAALLAALLALPPFRGWVEDQSPQHVIIVTPTPQSVPSTASPQLSPSK